MRKRRFSITQQQAESICTAIALAEIAVADVELQSPAHLAYFTMRRKEWDAISTKLFNYKWKIE